MELTELPSYETLEDAEIINFTSGRLVRYENSKYWRADILVDGIYKGAAVFKTSRDKAINKYHNKILEHRGIIPSKKIKDGLKDCRTCNNRQRKLYKGFCDNCQTTQGL